MVLFIGATSEQLQIDLYETDMMLDSTRDRFLVNCTQHTCVCNALNVFPHWIGLWVDGEHCYNFYTTTQVICECFKLKTDHTADVPVLTLYFCVCQRAITQWPLCPGLVFLTIVSFSPPHTPFPLFPSLAATSLMLGNHFAYQDISSGWVNITFYYLSVGAVTILVSRYSLVSWQGKKTQSGFNFRITSLNVGNKHHYFCYSESHLFIFQDIAHILHTAGYGTKEFSLLRLFFIVIEVLRYCPSVFVCLTVWMGSNQWGLIGVTLFWTEVGGGDIVVRSVARCCIT